MKYAIVFILGAVTLFGYQMYQGNPKVRQGISDIGSAIPSTAGTNPLPPMPWASR